MSVRGSLPYLRIPVALHDNAIAVAVYGRLVMLLAFISEVIAMRTGGALTFYQWRQSGLRCANGWRWFAHGLILVSEKQSNGKLKRKPVG
jgi:hypothetical protein